MQTAWEAPTFQYQHSLSLLSYRTAERLCVKVSDDVTLQYRWLSKLDSVLEPQHAELFLFITRNSFKIK